MNVPTAPKHVQELAPYQPGKSIEEMRRQLGLEKIIKLASNENPAGPSPRAMQRIKEAISTLHIYPNAGIDLRAALAKKHGISINHIAAGSGSESILAAAMRAYLQPGDEVLTAEGTFIGFYVLANAQNLKLKTVPLKNYTYDLDAILGAITRKTKLIYIANPNNPTGVAFNMLQFEQFLNKLPEGPILVMDEAYFEYARDWIEYPDSLDYRHDQILTLRTFSKAYGLAGVRIGYGIAHDSIISNILKVKLPFEPTSLAQAAGLGALEDRDFLTSTIRCWRDGHRRLVSELRRLGFEIPISVANFILVPMGSDEKAQWLSDELLKRGVIARPMVPFRLPDCVRITIGSRDETTFLIQALRDIFGK